MKEKPTSRDLQARETRQKLLDAAMDLIAGEGYASATISRICKAAGVSVGTFYSYFDSKREIVALMSRKRNEEIYEAAQTLDFSKPARQVYLDYVRLTMEHIKRLGYIHARAILEGMMEVPDVGGLNHGIQLRQESIRRILEHGCITGEFSTERISKDDFYWLYSAAFHGSLALWCFRDGQLDIVEDGLQKLGPLVGLLTVSPSPAV